MQSLIWQAHSEQALTGWSLAQVVLTSAAVAALISSLITLVGQALERRQRREELILAKALEMAKIHTEILIKTADASGKTVPLYDNVIKAETYYVWLKHLLKSGKLPVEADKFKPPKS